MAELSHLRRRDQYLM